MNACISKGTVYNLHSDNTGRNADMYIKKMPLTFEQVDERVSYEPDTGIFRWKVAPCRRMKAGDECGTVKAGRKDGKATYKYIRILYSETPAARVAWLLTPGEWPDTNIVFKDGDTRNLRIDN